MNGLRLTAAVRKEGCRLLHQQCWLWGHDVRRPEGNLLLRAGFARVRPPAGVVGCSQYTLHLPGDRRVRLWGFGISFEVGEHAVYLNRFQFEPRVVDLRDDVWQAGALQGDALPRDAAAVVQAVRWIAGYEEAVVREQGTAYRVRCLAGWKGKAVSPDDLPGRWRELANSLEMQQPRCRRPIPVKCFQPPPRVRHGQFRAGSGAL